MTQICKFTIYALHSRETVVSDQEMNLSFFFYTVVAHDYNPSAWGVEINYEAVMPNLGSMSSCFKNKYVNTEHF